MKTEQPDKRSRLITVDVYDWPVIAGAFIVVSADIVVWLSYLITHHRMSKGGISTLILACVLDMLVQILPFVLIKNVIKGLIREKAGKSEIYLKMMFMLTPVAILTGYWQATYIDPFARALLLFMNLVLVVVGSLVGKFVFKVITNK